jgi:hypothetical protein
MEFWLPKPRFGATFGAIFDSHFRGERMESNPDRRASRRFIMSLPVTVRWQGTHDLVERQGRTRDVSFRGLYFLCEAPVEAGNEIEFVLTLPKEITLAGDVHIRCFGRVTRVEKQNGLRGIAARIERYEFLPVPARPASASA